MLPRERENRRGRYAAILICVTLGVMLGVWRNQAMARGHSDGVTAAVRTATMPLTKGVSDVGDWFSRQVRGLLHWRSLEAENRRLREENARLREENAHLREADITAQRLRAQLGFPASRPPEKLAADVVALRPNPNFNTMIIARGTRDGVKLRSVVVAPEGVVGYVYDAAPTSSIVLLLTDSNAAIGAMVQRPSSRAVGICKGNDTDLLQMTYLEPAADVQEGDRIISSGKGGELGIFPKGLVIGTVAAVANSPSGALRSVLVRPAVNFNRLEEVYVLK